MRKPYITYSIMAVNAVIFVLLYFFARYDFAAYLVASRETVFGGLQLWRLVTSCFIHFTPAHIIFNTFSLYIFGTRVEQVSGAARFSAIYMLSGVIGALACCVVYSGVSGGASGAIFGVGGALAVYTRRRGSVAGIDFNVCLILLAGNIVGGLAASGVANAAHIAGLLCGGALAAVFWRKGK